MAQPTPEEIAAADRNIMYRLDSIAHVSRNVNRESIRCLSTVRRQQSIYLDPCAEPYLERAGLLPLARLCDAWFKVDEPLISAFVERWRPERTIVPSHFPQILPFP
ncbi:hypothetical protein PIB30_091720 [Stylosanthes scabra]|uniref:Uncharacterized protein n=1 Tax=Stylosanthes scabra TaxID=79078 RepID=A0ABU6UTE6_9FABA|nr:hypothetical protein [Stylosanthes scabra]